MINPSLLDELLNQATAQQRLPCAVAGVTGRENNLYLGAAGVHELDGKRSASIDSLFQIASMSKPVTSVVAMMLVDEGLLELDSPAEQWAPALAEARVLSGFDAAGRALTRAPARALTLRQLLNHTCGLANETWSADTIRAIGPTLKPGTLERYQATLHAPLLFDPGLRWWYGLGVDWAGKMIEAATSMRLGEVLRQRLFEPLGMNDTDFRLNNARRERLATVYQRDEHGQLNPERTPPPDIPPAERGGGGLYSTVGDYLKFIRFILNDGRVGGTALLSAASMDRLKSNQLGELTVQDLETAIPLRSNPMRLFPGIDKTWSLGFMRNEQRANTGRPAGSLGWAGIYNTHFWIDLENHIGGAVFSQLLPFLDSAAYGLTIDFETDVYRQLVSGSP